MSNLPASAGWSWIREGFAIFRKQPGGLILLMLAYLLAGAVLGIIPLVGPLAVVILAPVFTAVFMQACEAADRDVRITPEQLRPAFSKPALPRLAALGLTYLAVAALVMSASLLVDGGMFLQLATGQVKPESPEAQAANTGMALLFMLALYLPAAMASFFAAPLIFWQQMKLGKALFYSFFAVLRALKPFLVYFLSWMAIFVLTSQLLGMVLGRGNLGKAVIQSLTIMMIMIVHCSVYAAYRTIFGVPGRQQADGGELPPV